METAAASTSAKREYVSLLDDSNQTHLSAGRALCTYWLITKKSSLTLRAGAALELALPLPEAVSAAAAAAAGAGAAGGLRVPPA